MNKDTLINLRVTKNLKDDFQTIVEYEGFTMSEVLEASMKDIVKREMIPINIRSRIEKKRQCPITIPFIKKCLDEILNNKKDDRILSVSLFGSYSKGTATSNSDVDLYLEVEEGFNLFDYAELQNSLETALGKKVDLVTKNDDEFFMNHIRREKIQLYEKETRA